MILVRLVRAGAGDSGARGRVRGRCSTCGVWQIRDWFAKELDTMVLDKKREAATVVQCVYRLRVVLGLGCPMRVQVTGSLRARLSNACTGYR